MLQCTVHSVQCTVFSVQCQQSKLTRVSSIPQSTYHTWDCGDQVGYCPKLLMSLTAEWLELLSPVLGVNDLNIAVSGVITEKDILAAGFFYLLCGLADTRCRL